MLFDNSRWALWGLWCRFNDQCYAAHTEGSLICMAVKGSDRVLGCPNPTLNICRASLRYLGLYPAHKGQERAQGLKIR